MELEMLLSVLNKKELLAIGFRYWNENLLLIPEKFHDIFLSPIHSDESRFGMLYYGFKKRTKHKFDFSKIYSIDEIGKDAETTKE
jgi:hypothetical protein